MADQDELRLRIVPELDQNAKKQVEDDLNTISGNIPIGGKPKSGGSDPEAGARKQRLADYRAEIDLIDLTLRKATSASQRRTQLLEQEAAQGKRSLQETAQLLAQEESIRANATAEAIKGYDLIGQELEQLGSSQQDVINRQKQLFFASERAQNGFTTMSGSMTTLTSNTKSANIAFANFGRIVQDAPFGLLGISNNIDPLLNSFRELKQETGGTGLALRAMGRQLLGPAGLIFLLGSALPTALIFLQDHLRKTKKEVGEVGGSVEVMAKAIDSALGTAVSGVNFSSQQREIEAIESALKKVGGSVMAIRPVALDINKIYSATADATAQTSQNVTAQANAVTGILSQQESLEPKIRAELEERLASLKATELIAKALRNVGFVQDQVNESLRKAREETAMRLNLERQSLRVSQELMRSTADMLDDAEAFDEFEIKTGKIANTTLETYRNLALERVQFERQFTDSSVLIQQERDLKLEEIAKNRLSLGLRNENAYQQQRQLIIDEYAAQEVELARAVAMNKADEMAIYGQAVSAGLGAIFGENKAVQSAQVVIDTITGANKAFAALMPNFPLAVAAASTVTAQGAIALRKINSTQKGAKSLGRSSASASSASPSPSLPFVNDLGLAGQVAGTITPFGASMSPSINITANLDRQGLALAVRDGEADIATRQIPFAS
jgi:hypothetical protein